MDDATAQYYALNAAALAARYESVESPIARYFDAAFAAGSSVLDIGAGSGRDLARLLAFGFDAYAAEPSDALREEAIRHHPELRERLGPGSLPNIGLPFGKTFDGVVCSAVLMHVSEADLFDAAFSLRQLLRPNGRLLVSLPLERTDIGAGQRDAEGRLFKPYTAEYLQLLLERLGFQHIGRWDSGDALQRPGTCWFTLLFELRATAALRAVDQIEGILNRDRKVATYKLALFRALAELATQEPHCAAWHATGTVGVPIARIAEKWLAYYWPIFASSQRIPQSQAEGAGTTQPVLFRAAVEELMAPYRQSGEYGGLAAWQLDTTTGRLSPATQASLKLALQSISRAIREGPVKHAGGALDTGTVFKFDRASSRVVMSAEIWREFSLLGHWIRDAVILRWAELTERFGHRQAIRSADVLPLLLARPEPERATQVARQVFVDHHVERCAWSDRRLVHTFCVDHVIPFSLWGSNDLWNLLPTHPQVNNDKSDRLPSRQLLKDRQPHILTSWRLLRDAMPAAFDRQAGHLLGRSVGGALACEDELFARLREAIEITALQRGVERWAPGRADTVA